MTQRHYLSHIRISTLDRKYQHLKYIDEDINIEELTEFLTHIGWIKNERVVSVEIPGAGNMNVVIRVKTDQKSFILKQSRPFVKKFDQLEAPLDRIKTEFEFYQSVKGIDDYVPDIQEYDPTHYLLMMEDLGQTKDLTSLYGQRDVSFHIVSKLVDIAAAIHQSPVGPGYPRNMALRELNHQHIFVLPFEKDNGFDLDEIQPGLDQLAITYKDDQALKNEVRSIGKLYLSPGACLIHGDYYPGSWMENENQIFVLDPEFSFVGFKEFDIGVMCGHLFLASGENDLIQKVILKYPGTIDEHLVKQVAGIEIMRRLIGLAQLPLIRSIEEKSAYLQEANQLILG